MQMFNDLHRHSSAPCHENGFLTNASMSRKVFTRRSNKSTPPSTVVKVVFEYIFQINRQQYNDLSFGLETGNSINSLCDIIAHL